MRCVGSSFPALPCAQSCLTLCDPRDCSLPGSSVHGDSPGKSTGVGYRGLLQGIFQVFAFVYDEIRDYYIARRIMQASAKQDSFDCDSIIRSVQIIRESKASCEEGVIQYTYDFFRTASEIDDEDRIRYCNQILDFYRIEDGHRTQYWHSHHREEFINYGLKIDRKSVV